MKLSAQLLNVGTKIENMFSDYYFLDLIWKNKKKFEKKKYRKTIFFNQKSFSQKYFSKSGQR